MHCDVNTRTSYKRNRSMGVGRIDRRRQRRCSVSSRKDYKLLAKEVESRRKRRNEIQKNEMLMKLQSFNLRRGNVTLVESKIECSH